MMRNINSLNQINNDGKPLLYQTKYKLAIIKELFVLIAGCILFQLKVNPETKTNLELHIRIPG
jgi:hypothetical protein